MPRAAVVLLQAGCCCFLNNQLNI